VPLFELLTAGIFFFRLNSKLSLKEVKE